MIIDDVVDDKKLLAKIAKIDGYFAWKIQSELSMSTSIGKRYQIVTNSHGSSCEFIHGFQYLI